MTPDPVRQTKLYAWRESLLDAKWEKGGDEGFLKALQKIHAFQ